MKALLRLLSPFKFARRKLGGTWYYVELLDSAGGIEGTVQYWTQKEPDEYMEVIKTEEYP
jgi:uncharacterized protein YbcV (DUF1398 family)